MFGFIFPFVYDIDILLPHLNAGTLRNACACMLHYTIIYNQLQFSWASVLPEYCVLEVYLECPILIWPH